MPWYEDLFTREDPLRFEVYRETEASLDQVDFVIEKLGLKPGMRVLDLCCGQGRHLIGLMRRGCEVTGVDLSEYMLSQCRSAAASEGFRPRLIRTDMREIDFQAEFDAVINMYTSFGYLETDEDDQRVLDRVAMALRPGGRFLLDTVNRDWFLRVLPERHWDANSRGDVIVSESQFDSLTGRNNVREITFSTDGHPSELSYSLRYYTFQEISRMIRASGMEVTSVWGGFDSSPYSFSAHRMMVVASRVDSGE